MTQRTLVISDVHGCYEEFVGLLQEKQYDPQKDELIILGDLIDRGPQSYNVVQKAKELHKNGAIILRGNHEQLAIDYYCSNDPTWFHNGARETVVDYARNDSCAEYDVDFFKSLPLTHVIDDYIFVHAGLRPGIPLEKQKTFDLLWIRDEFLWSSYDWGKKVVFGHTIMKEISFLGNKIGIDTGCFATGKLSCLELQGGEYHDFP